MKYRNVIYLFYYEEYSVSMIAKILHKKEATILIWLHRARKQLKVNLKEGDENE
ncbi:sigma factor-like helix-turn-helix DNA-binding protein [Erysipelotrichaceae bacterium HCN-30851]